MNKNKLWEWDIVARFFYIAAVIQKFTNGHRQKHTFTIIKNINGDMGYQSKVSLAFDRLFCLPVIST